MTYSLTLLLLAFAVSIDSFSTGLAYGLRGIRVPLKSISIIALCSAATLLVAMLFGKVIAHILSPLAANRFGGVILILLGIWIFYQFFRRDKEKVINERVIFKYEIKSIGLVINILRKPTRADFDDSGVITGIEALILGIALSLDAFAAGIGAAILGFPPIILACMVAFMSSIFLLIGLKSGSKFSHIGWIQKMSFIPGLILIFIGMLKI